MAIKNKEIEQAIKKLNIRVFKLEEKVRVLENPDGPGGTKIQKTPKNKMVKSTETK